MAAPHKALRTGELAHLTGLSPDSIRHYEKVGILSVPSRTASGYRMYGRDAVERVLLVQRALQLGFRLNELSEILRVRDNGGVPCHRVLNMAEAKLLSLDRQIDELRQTQRYMRKLVRQWRETLGHTKPGSKALLLHSLVDGPVLLTKHGKNFGGKERL